MAGDGVHPRGLDPRRLEGRSEVLAELDEALQDARGGRGSALVVRGGPGSGRSAVLAAIGTEALDFTPLSTGGVAGEHHVPYSGLHRLLRPLAHLVPLVPSPQADALRLVLGERDGPVQNSLVLDAAVLDLLARAAAGGPLLCRIDDADQLDAESLGALAFAARRAASHPIVLVLALEERPGGGHLLPGLRSLDLAPLDDAAGRAVLKRLLAGRVGDDETPDDVVTALVSLAHGNPLALVELAGALSPGQLQGLEPLPDVLPAGSTLRRRYRDRLRQLPAPARRLALAIAAADDVELDTVLRLVAAPGIGEQAMDDVEASGIVAVEGARVSVPDPLARACLYAGARLADRLAAHTLLAGALDTERHGLERAWHRAAALAGPIQELADDLCEAAQTASGSGDHAGASRALQRSASLTRTPGTAGERLVAAARAAWLTGDGRRARMLLRQARPLAATPELRGLVDLLQGEIEARSGTAEGAYGALAAVAEGLAGPHRTQAVVALMREIELSEIAGDHPRFIALARRVAGMRSADELPATQVMFDHFAGLSAAYQGDHERAAGPLRRVVELAPSTRDPVALVLAANAALTLADTHGSRRLAEQAVTEARGQDTSQLPYMLEWLAFTEFRTERYAAATMHSLEGLRLARQAGQENSAASHLGILALLASLHGDTDAVLPRARAAAREAGDRGLARPAAMTSWATTRLALAHDRPEDAGAVLRTVVGSRRGMHMPIQVVATPDLVEVAAAHGERAWSAGALATFENWAGATASRSMQAMAARSRAVLAADDGEAAERFREAVDLHTGCGTEFERARTQLLYGRALRRRRRPGAAREPLHEALEVFEAFGATPWAERARSELRAAGGALPAASAAPGTSQAGTSQAGTSEAGLLTPQQAQVARLVCNGATNREVAAQLFLSPRTVDHHLRNIFARLGVRSRVELARRLS